MTTEKSKAWAPTTCTRCGVDKTAVDRSAERSAKWVPGVSPEISGALDHPCIDNGEHEWFTPEVPSATPPTSDTEAAMREQGIERPEGEWGWRAGELPKGAPLVYELGRWYRSGRGVEFMLAVPARRVTGRPGYWVGSVLFRDGHVDALKWGPATRPLPWWVRLLRWLGVKAPEITA
jgi:hypothetical protein